MTHSEDQGGLSYRPEYYAEQADLLAGLRGRPYKNMAALLRDSITAKEAVNASAALGQLRMFGEVARNTLKRAGAEISPGTRSALKTLRKIGNAGSHYRPDHLKPSTDDLIKTFEAACAVAQCFLQSNSRPVSRVENGHEQSAPKSRSKEPSKVQPETGTEASANVKSPAPEKATSHARRKVRFRVIEPELDVVTPTSPFNWKPVVRAAIACSLLTVVWANKDVVAATFSVMYKSAVNVSETWLDERRKLKTGNACFDDADGPSPDFECIVENLHTWADKGNKDAQFKVSIALDRLGRPADAALYDQMLSDAKDASGMVRFGSRLLRGDGISVDDERGRDLVSAGEMGGEIHPLVLLDLGYLYRDGIGVSQNEYIAIRHFKSALDKGVREAEVPWITSCVELLLQGREVSNCDGASDRLFQMIDDGSGAIFFLQGQAYEGGVGGQVNGSLARKSYHAARATGHIEAAKWVDQFDGYRRGDPGWQIILGRAEAGDAEAARFVGNSCAHETKTQGPDYNCATRFLRPFADDGEQGAQLEVAIALQAIGKAEEAAYYDKQLADAKNPNGIVRYGHRLIIGDGVTADINRGTELVESAGWFSQDFDPRVSLELGRLYRHGIGVEKRRYVPIRLFRHAMKSGVNGADREWVIACMEAEADGRTDDGCEGADASSLGIADDGSGELLYWEAVAIERGIDREPNEYYAKEVYEKSRRRGNVRAAIRLSELEGYYVRDEGWKLIKEKADQGDIEAQRYVGLSCLEGSKASLPDYRCAWKYLSPLASSDDPKTTLAASFVADELRRPKDAARMDKILAESDDPNGLLRYGERLFLGNGVSADPAYGAKLINQGKYGPDLHPKVRLQLGYMYALGFVVEQNNYLAAKQFKRAMDEGEAEAELQLAKVCRTIRNSNDADYDMRAKAYYPPECIAVQVSTLAQLPTD